MLWQPRLPDEYLARDPEETAARIESRRRELGDRLLVLGHHYQQDDVIRHADLTGDSLKLSRMAAEEARRRGTEFIVFCGVHFMAETADIVTDDSVQVLLPDLSAGCSMADMAQWDDVNDCWDALAAIPGGRRIVHDTYVNSSAAVKAFVGMHDGACCTSSNAGAVFDWARAGGERPEDGPARVLFLPDQHLGRNTAHARGLRTEVDVAAAGDGGAAETVVWDPKLDGGASDDAFDASNDASNDASDAAFDAAACAAASARVMLASSRTVRGGDALRLVLSLFPGADPNDRDRDGDAFDPDRDVSWIVNAVDPKEAERALRRAGPATTVSVSSEGVEVVARDVFFVARVAPGEVEAEPWTALATKTTQRLAPRGEDGRLTLTEQAAGLDPDAPRAALDAFVRERGGTKTVPGRRELDEETRAAVVRASARRATRDPS